MTSHVAAGTLFAAFCLSALLGLSGAVPVVGPAAAQEGDRSLTLGGPDPRRIIQAFLEQSGLLSAQDPALFRGLGQLGPVQPESAERSGCTDYRVEPQEIATDSAAARHTLTVSTIGARAPWQVSASVPWMTVAKAAGSGDGTAVVNLDANPGPLARSGAVTLLCGGETVRTVPVRQPAPP